MNEPVLWPAPQASAAFNATVHVPGSKSITNRALILAAISDGPSKIWRPLHALDTMYMAAALRSLGIGGSDLDDPHSPVRGWEIIPQPMTGPATINCGLAGTVMRFIPALASLAHGEITIDGDPQARVRPMQPVIAALRELGVTIDDGGRGLLPFTLRADGPPRGGHITLDASASSQFVSALLLVAPAFTEGLTIEHAGGAIPSLPHIDMTVQMLRERGVDVTAHTEDPTHATWSVQPGPIKAVDVVIEPDLSNAAPFLAAAAVTGNSVTIAGWPGTTTQAGARFPELLQAMGARVSTSDDALTVRGGDNLAGIDVDMREVGELVPTLAAVAVLADSPTTITGIAHLRGHETDRLKALEDQINSLGGHAQQTSDGLVITPAPLHGGTWHSYNDHRMATAGAIIGLCVSGVQVENIATTEKTLPGFVELWNTMLGQTQ